MASSARVGSLLPIAVKLLALPALSADAASADARAHVIATAGVSLQIPSGWQARVAKTPACDPERLIVASSPIHNQPHGALAAPRPAAVLVVLLQDRYPQDRPVGDLQRPRRFSVTWTRLSHLESCCGLPDAPAYMRYVKIRGRYLGFIVFPGSAIGAKTRAATLTLMNSLRVVP